jgi:hypothetical protein
MVPVVIHKRLCLGSGMPSVGTGICSSTVLAVFAAFGH